MMRDWRWVLAAGAVLVLALSGCTKSIAGTAQPDPRKPGVAVTSDGYGILAGFADAPVQLELFTEPQCDHCADLQSRFGDEIKGHLTSGELAVTYRPLTFLDDAFDIDYSAVAANTLFLAVGPSTTASTFQTFVEDLWANQDLSYEDYADGDFADIARDSGLSDDIVDNIGAGKSAVDTGEMDSFNAKRLLGDGAGTVHTPVVYDVDAKAIVDTGDDDWLAKLLKSG